MYEVKGANKDLVEKQVTGTYVPKEFILDIASWISIEFYDKCNNIILNYFVKEFKKMDTKTLKSKIKQVEDQMEKLALEKDTVIQKKDDHISELKELLLKHEEERKLERQKDREIILRQEQYMRSLGISLEEVKDQNEELLDETKGLKKQNTNLQSSSIKYSIFKASCKL